MRIWRITGFQAGLLPGRAVEVARETREEAIAEVMFQIFEAASKPGVRMENCVLSAEPIDEVDNAA